MPVTSALPTMHNKRAILILLFALSLPLPAQASDDIFSIMFRMMLTMMNVMANAADDDSGAFNNWGMNNWDLGGTNSLGMGMTTLPMMSGMGAMNPWSSYRRPRCSAAPRKPTDSPRRSSIEPKP